MRHNDDSSSDCIVILFMDPPNYVQWILLNMYGIQTYKDLSLITCDSYGCRIISPQNFTPPDAPLGSWHGVMRSWLRFYVVSGAPRLETHADNSPIGILLRSCVNHIGE